ncbi:MFS transporter [Demequina sp.]|uniref:MFS transporter n=1 Tax=Demequina sp. TaxID=2050685 RepID=UPI003D100983
MADAVLTRARTWATLGFVVQGLLQALVLTNLPGLEDRTGIDDTQVSFVVLSVLVFAAIGSLLGGSIALRKGSAFLLLPAFAIQATALLLAMINLPYAALFPVYALFGLGVGLGDAGNGMQGLTVQRAYGRPIFTTFYAFQTAAAITGALLVAGINGTGAPFETAFLVGAVVAVAALPGLRRGLVRDPEVGVPESAKPTLPWRGLTLFGLVILVVYVGDGVVSTWSPVYLDKTFMASAAVLPLGYAAYQGTVLVARIIGDRIVAAVGRVFVVVFAVILATAGFAVAAVAPVAWLAVGGFAVVGLGLGVLVPLAFSASGDLAPEQIDEIVSRLNLFNYVGVVVGSAATGIIADATTWRVALLVPAALILGILTVARTFRERPVPPVPVAN